MDKEYISYIKGIFSSGKINITYLLYYIPSHYLKIHKTFSTIRLKYFFSKNIKGPLSMAMPSSIKIPSYLSIFIYQGSPKMA